MIAVRRIKSLKSAKPKRVTEEQFKEMADYLEVKRNAPKRDNKGRFIPRPKPVVVNSFAGPFSNVSPKIPSIATQFWGPDTDKEFRVGRK